MKKRGSELWGCSGLPQKVLSEIRCDCCSQVIYDGEKVYYDGGVVLHFRRQCLSGHYNRLMSENGKLIGRRRSSLTKPLRVYWRSSS